MDDMASFLDGVDGWKESKPGSKFFYLNEGYYILGEVISKVSGMSYYDFLKKEILNPLEMKRTFLSKEDVERDGDYALPYLLKDEGKLTRSVVPWGSGAAGGIMSNVLDLSNYLTMYLGRGEFSGRKIISEEMIEKMESQYAKPPISIFPDNGYGYGLFTTNEFFGEKLVRHDGSVSVYTSGIAYLPRKGIGISILCNGSGYPCSALVMYALTLLLGKDPEKDLAPIRRERLLHKLEGTYKAYKNTVSAEIKRNGDFLMLSGEDIDSHILAPSEECEKGETASFFTLERTARMEVEFRLNEHGVEMIFERYKYRKTEPAH